MEFPSAIRLLEEIERNPEIVEQSNTVPNFPKDVAVADIARVKFDQIVSAYSKELHKYMDDFLSGKISKSQAIDRMTSAMSKSLGSSYIAGKEFMTGVKSKINADDAAYLTRAAEYEAGFIRNFVDDMYAGIGSMDYGRRADLYMGAMRGSFNNAAVEYAPDDVNIYWRLMPAEHCDDCVSLGSMNPWKKTNLPTLPGAGDTRCGGSCKCVLEYEKVKSKTPKSARPSGASKIFGLPQAPPGLNVPSAEERIYIENIRQNMNYWRREIVLASDSGNIAAEKVAMAARKDANDELIRYLEKNNLWSPPLLSVDEVISGRTLDDKLIEALFANGVDGSTVASLSEEAFNELIEEIVKGGVAIDAIIKSINK